jgi:uncharacterized Tic20 family protein/DNA-binding Xre family transcriptional regulator
MMNQPDLGLKVNELRLQKNLTQEKLAEVCEVSTRTIQRIENGEVDPRTHTLYCLSKALEFDFGADQTSRENLWIAVLHLSSIFCILLIPILIWSWKKPQSNKIDVQGKLVLNFQITMTLLLVGAVLLLMFGMPAMVIFGEQSGGTLAAISPLLAVLGILPLILIGIFCTYQGVINAIRALSDRPVKYQLTIPFIK